MLKYCWHICFFASVAALVFAFGLSNSQSLIFTNGKSAPPTTQNHSANKPIELIGGWLFLKNEFPKSKEELITHFLTLSPNAIFSEASNDSLKPFSYPDSVVSALQNTSPTDAATTTHLSTYQQRRESLIGALTYNQVFAGTYIFNIAKLPDYFRSEQLLLKLDPSCGFNQLSLLKTSVENSTSIESPQSTSQFSEFTATSSAPIPLGEINGAVFFALTKIHDSPSSQCRPPLIGTTSQLTDYEIKFYIKNSLLLGVLFSIALYALGMYVYFRKELENFWLGAWSFSTAFIFFNFSGFWHLTFSKGFSFPTGLTNRFELIGITALCLFAVQYYYNFISAIRTPLTFKILNLTSAFLLFGFILFSEITNLSIVRASVISYAAAQVLIVIILYFFGFQSLTRKEQFLTFVGLFTVFCACLNDFGLIWLSSSLSPMVFNSIMILLLCNAIIQSRRVTLVFNSTSKISASLADEVRYKSDTLEVKNRLLLKVQNQLKESNKELKALSITDALTNTYNRLYFDSHFALEWQRCMRDKTPFSLILIDIDHFKKINDIYGHLAGDHCLKLFAERITSIFQRSNDFVCRYGGEEFAILLPNSAPSQALEFSEKLRRSVENSTIEFSHQLIRFTISIGIAGIIPQPNIKHDQLFKAADKALYYVKNNGRNGIKLENLEATPKPYSKIRSKKDAPDTVLS